MPSGNEIVDENNNIVQELGAGGVCDLGNVNLTKFVIDPFGSYSAWENNFNWEHYESVISSSVRFLDNVLDVSDYPFEDLAKAARNSRRIGLNVVSGLGSFLAMMKVPYDSDKALDIACTLQVFGMIIAYRTSIELASEKGCFADYTTKYSNGHFFSEKVFPYLTSKYQEMYTKYGIRNSVLLTLPPVGTGSILAHNISSGGEPIFELENYRNIIQPDGTKKQVKVNDYAWRIYNKLGKPDGEKPPYFKTTYDISPMVHVKMQAILQSAVDNSISKTCNMKNDVTLEEYKDILMFAIDSKCKGITTFRQGTREGVLLTKEEVESSVKDTIEVKSLKPFVLPSRDRVLDGKTYKIKDPHGNVYVTCNYSIVNGKKRPTEIFIFSSNENQEMYAALGKTLSAIMRRNDDISFIIDDLKSIKASSESGGYFDPTFGFVKSRPMHLGLILDEFISSLEQELENEPCSETKSKYKPTREICPDCGASLMHQGGCKSCSNCSWSACG